MTINWTLYSGCIAGILISVLLPPLWAIVKEQFKPVPPGVAPKTFTDSVADTWPVLRPYVALWLASALTALLLVAFLGDKIQTFEMAILAGYAWDSTLQKLK